MKSISISPILLLALYISTGNCQQAQFIRFWNAANCLGNHALEVRVSGSISIPTGTRSLGFTVNGLWSVRTCNAFSCDIPTIRQTSACLSFILPSDTRRIEVTRYGDANQIDRRIHLFSASNLQGTPVIVGESNITFPSPRDFSSYYFTGRNSWDLLNEGEYRITCLNPTITGPGDYGIRYDLTATLRNVKTVIFGCGNGGTPPTTTTTTTSTTTTTTRLTTTTTVRTSSTTRNPWFGRGNAVETSLTTLLLGFFALFYFKI